METTTDWKLTTKNISTHYHGKKITILNSPIYERIDWSNGKSEFQQSRKQRIKYKQQMFKASELGLDIVDYTDNL
jgi:hypothetical protein